MQERDSVFVADRVRHYLQGIHPGGATLEVLENQIWRDEFAWNVPIQPDFQPKRLFEYYESLADVMIELADNENLNVYLVASDSKADISDQAA